MKLSKKETEEIAEQYGLGKVKSVKLIKGGNISHNFIFRTEKGEFIVRALGYKLERHWERQKELEFKVLEFLIDKKFPYQVPNFLKNKKGEYISTVNGKLVETYPRIKGRIVVKMRKEHIIDMANALAAYHKAISKFEVPKDFKKLDDYGWIRKELEEMSKVKQKNSLDRLMLKHVEFFLGLLDKNKKFDKGLIVGHHDFHKWNILFNDGKLTGILDFENLEYGPKIDDLFFDPRSLENSFLFIKEYMKHNKLSKAELKNFVPQKILGNCYSFWWAYKGKMKNENKRMMHLRHIVKKIKKYQEFDDFLRRRFRI
jgi:Ser/Thr protein kinase RdoA (MazF antagonist)